MRALVPVLLCLAAMPAAAQPRVANARKAKADAIAAMFRDAKVAYPPGEIYLRVFKFERELELWAGPKRAPLVKVKTWPVCAASGELGPKRMLNDMQVPEGFYRIDRFNPSSNFHLSLGLDYPNASDRILGKKGRLGGDIFIHGSCVTIGCVPIEDDGIEELYLVALDAKSAGQKAIPVHVFPARLGEEGMRRLGAFAGERKDLLAFWEQLRPAYELFEKTRRPPAWDVDRKTGAYKVRAGR